MLVAESELAPAPSHKCVGYVPEPPKGLPLRTKSSPAQTVAGSGVMFAASLLIIKSSRVKNSVVLSASKVTIMLSYTFEQSSYTNG